MRYRFGDHVLDTQRAELHRAGAPIKLRRKAFQVLAYLLAHRDRVVPKQELLEQLWPEQFVGDEVLKACIKALRKALGESGGRRALCARCTARAIALWRRWRCGSPSRRTRRPPTSPRTPRYRLPSRRAARRYGSRAPGQCPGGGIQTGDGAVWRARRGAQPGGAPGPGGDVPPHARRAGAGPGTVQRYGGTLLQVSGEGFLALFGAPVAHEDHARRAVLAALELRQRLRVPEALRGQPAGVALRLGLHTGPVVVGPLGQDPPQLYTAGGATLAQATQLQQQAASRYRPVQRRHLRVGAGGGSGRGVGQLPWRRRVLPSRRVCGTQPPAAPGGRPAARWAALESLCGPQPGSWRSCTSDWRKRPVGRGRCWVLPGSPAWASRGCWRSSPRVSPGSR